MGSLDADALIYHYTGLDAATGILSSGTFWATHIQHFVNDPREYKLGREVALDVISQRAANDPANPIWELIAAEPDWGVEGDLYVTSFTDVRNSPRHFNDFGCIAIGIRAAHLRELLAAQELRGEDARLEGNRNGVLRTDLSSDGLEPRLFAPCVYDGRDIARLFECQADDVLDMCLWSNQVGLGGNAMAPIFYWGAVHLYGSLAKLDHFNEEREWRVVRLRRSDDREGPFVDGRQAPTLIWNIPAAVRVAELIIGPGCDPSAVNELVASSRLPIESILSSSDIASA